MSPALQVFFFGMGLLSFLIGAIVAFFQPAPETGPRRPVFWVLLGLLLITVVPFWVALKAA